MSETKVMMLAMSSKKGSKQRRVLREKGQVTEQATKSLTKTSPDHPDLKSILNEIMVKR